jgi:hypothetical protein
MSQETPWGVVGCELGVGSWIQALRRWRIEVGGRISEVGSQNSDPRPALSVVHHPSSFANRFQL